MIKTQSHHQPTVMDILDSVGIRPTSFRRQILMEVRAQTSPVTPSGLFRTLPEGLSIGSVYRILAQLYDRGLLERHHLSNGKLAYTYRHERQDLRIICPDCGKAAPVEASKLDGAFRETLRGLGFLDSRATISAPCVECAHPPTQRGRKFKQYRRITAYDAED
ncbi:TPA: Fur family transcriptional regulator [Stenotrophomonas maltophilia]